MYHIACDVETRCWRWLGSKTPGGYGRVTFEKKFRSAHRFSYETFVGPIPPGLQIDHLCEQPECVNPDHLEPVTPLQNSYRAAAHNGRKTACPQGHRYTLDNMTLSSGRRYCRACRLERVREFRRRVRAA